MNVIKWLTEKQPKQGYLLAGLTVVQQFLETKLSLRFYINKLIDSNLSQDLYRKECWVSEIYLVVSIVFATIAYYLATPITGIRFVGFITVVCPIYLIAEILIFLLGWVFVHKSELHSIQRSLLAFILNMIELSLLFGALEISIGSGLPPSGKLKHFFEGVFHIATLASPTEVTSVQGSLEVIRLFVSLLLVLVIVGSLVGGILRTPKEFDNKK